MPSPPRAAPADLPPTPRPAQPGRSQTLRALPALLLLGAIWGLTPSLGKLLVLAGAAPLTLAALVGAGSAAMLGAVCAARGLRVPWDGAHLRHYAVAGGVGFALANLVAYAALRHVPAGLVALIVTLSPMLTVAIAAGLGVEQPTRRRLAGTLLGLAGTALALAPGAALPEARLLPWALLLLATPTCYAITNVLATRLAPRGTPPLPLAAGALAVGAAGAAAGAVLTGQATGLPLEQGATGLLLLALQAGLTALAYIAYFRLLASLGGVVTSQVGYLVTLVGLFWGFALFGEVPGWLTLPATGLIFTGLALVTLPPGMGRRRPAGRP